MRNFKAFSAAALFSFLSGCTGEAPGNIGVYMLVDTSGTYTEELTKAQAIINGVLAQLQPTDAFAVARIDTGSFSERDIVAKAEFEDRPSAANQQKRVFREKVNAFIEEAKPSRYTDISGGLLQAIEFLNEKRTDRKLILIFSDLEEDLKEGYIRDLPMAFDGARVIALNVTKLRSDNIDPRGYMNRLDAWRAKVEDGGGQWRVVNDLERIDEIWLP